MDAKWIKTARDRAHSDRRRLAELRRQLQLLEQEIVNLNAQVHSWDVILSAVDHPTPAWRPGEGNLGDEDEVEEHLAVQDTPSESEAQSVGRVARGLRGAIRDTLRKAPRGLLPREVARDLVAQNFQVAGRTDFGLRVSSELWRMHKAGALRKVQGHYVLLKAETDMTH